MPAVRSTFLRTVIALDAAACGVMGAAFAFDAGWLAGPLWLAASTTAVLAVTLRREFVSGSRRAILQRLP